MTSVEGDLAALADAPDQSGARAFVTRVWRRAAVGLALLTLAASAILAVDPSGAREQLFGSAAAARPAAVSRTAGGWSSSASLPVASGRTTLLRSEPWWQSLGTLQGSGAATAPALRIDGGASQWRLRWSCDRGALMVSIAGRARPLVDRSCPAGGDAYATTSGLAHLEVQATGPWRLEAQQDIDLPLDEPLPAEATQPGAQATAAGDLYRIDQVGQGRATLYHLPGGGSLIRLDNFYVSPNTDLEVRLSVLPAPHTTNEFSAAPSAPVGPLDVTAGSLNFTVPAGVDPASYRSVVIWCERLHSAYAAASLAPRS